MQAEFWLEKWQKPEHGWSQAKVNSRLRRHWSALGLESGARVLVPLCGDSIDMDWLIATGHRVCGCDLSENAFRTWSKRHNLQLEQSPGSGQGENPGPVHWHVSSDWPPENLLVDVDAAEVTAPLQVGDQLEPHLISGDFLNLEAADLPFVPQAVYDRAALIALTPELRLRYARKLAELLPVGARIFLITLKYDQQQMKGPPFSVTDEEVAELYSAHFELDCLTQSGGPDILGNLAERGLDHADESVFCLTRKSG